jgi:GNAT superfamily N-acetyltransferase
MAPTCYLQDLYVVPETRGQGLGAALINHVYAAADERGAAEVYWHTQEFNATARRLYDRIGRLTPFIQYRR